MRAGARVGALNCDVNLRMEPRMAGRAAGVCFREQQGRCSRALPTHTFPQETNTSLHFKPLFLAGRAEHETRFVFGKLAAESTHFRPREQDSVEQSLRLQHSKNKSHWGACGNRTSHPRKFHIRAGPERVSCTLPGTQRTMGRTGRAQGIELRLRRTLEAQGEDGEVGGARRDTALQGRSWKPPGRGC